jgi:DNA-directed RNA polymerase subunit RPC12/RpoP
MAEEGRLPDVTPCPNCGGRTLYASREMSSGGSHVPDYLDGLATSVWHSAKLRVVVCRDCGLARFFASQKALTKLSESKKWHAVMPSDRGGFR